jgi:quercetin dioxygenase-like cupin family protein
VFSPQSETDGLARFLYTARSNFVEEFGKARLIMATTYNRRRFYNPVQKDTATFLKTHNETNGEFSLAEVDVEPGGGTTPHFHLDYTEGFEVLEGELTVLLGNVTQTLRVGQKAVVPRNTLHRFINESDKPSKALIEIRPAHAGFEKMIAITYGLAADGKVNSKGIPKNPLVLALLLDMAGIKLPGFLKVIQPLFSLLATLAKRRGLQAQLEATYCKSLYQ